MNGCGCNNGFLGGNCAYWIIILICLWCLCGNNGFGCCGCNDGCGC